MDEQIKELTKTVMDIRLDLAKIDTKMDSIKDIQHKVEDYGTRITSVESSASSAHKRMDRIERIHAWLGGSIGVGFIAALVTFVVKGGLIK